LGRADVHDAHRKAVEVAREYMEHDAAQARVTVSGSTGKVLSATVISGTILTMASPV
jgi:hypothetical protein